jgi:single-stranded DNA-binding protein
MRVFVEGRFRTREYEARDGQKRISLEVTADDVISLDRGARGEGDAPAFPAEGARPATAAGGVSPIRRGGDAPAEPNFGDLDDLPF